MGTNIVLIFLVLIIISLLCYPKIQSWIDYYKEQRAIEFKQKTGLDLSSLYRLSAPKPYLENLILKPAVFYFDENNLYRIKPNEPLFKYPLSTIIEARRTMITINNRRVWKIIIDNAGQQLIYKLRAYKNFSLFLDKVRENPNAIVDNRYIWGIFE
ncbi:hypothetical protein [Flavobacterium sp. S87F.05.LMB.W.Kidney.N]|jgi:hypothetical protein|uniref:hypothetical protein n=1 Tax=Flavobacterium sp. S87F.05.LMB.W.Kidney.N TaxID=1278758 RepID=UPI001064DA6E|nr:hypothetical protein [Flavobacterium sp. S87F.05.LMB.W.Kidney.N]TDX11708.1 hypothetical protein EDB96_2500 [Flavobacterium sp. S87F.05.LMB.W.Kidney.N]